VGFLFFEDRDELLAALPERRPRYDNARLDPYAAVRSIGANEEADPFHFGGSLLRRIAERPTQEIGTHTFSHYYCLEEGQDREAFSADLGAAVVAARRMGIAIESIVFPRNQVNERYLATCAEHGILAYRGNPSAWMYRASAGAESLGRRSARFADSYVELTGRQVFAPERRRPGRPLNVSASRFLRPWTRTLRRVQPLQMRRIKREMTAAAKRGALYHLWWHPHNFGLDTEENLASLRELLVHFTALRDSDGMVSLNMGEVARRWGGTA
jgi:hypothetical protein